MNENKIVNVLIFLLILFFCGISDVFALSCNYTGTVYYQEWQDDKQVTSRYDVEVSCFYDSDSSKNPNCQIVTANNNSETIENWKNVKEGVDFIGKDYYDSLDNQCLPYIAYVDDHTLINRYHLYGVANREQADIIEKNKYTGASFAFLTSDDVSEDDIKTEFVEEVRLYINNLNAFNNGQEDKWNIYEYCQNDFSSPSLACLEAIRNLKSDLVQYQDNVTSGINQGLISSDSDEVKVFNEVYSIVQSRLNNIMNEMDSGGSSGNGDISPTPSEPIETEELESDLNLQKYCNEPNVARTLKFIGILLFIAKMFVPALIVIMGSVDFAQVIFAGKDDEIKKRLPIFIKRFITGVIIFFIPTIINFFFSVLDGYSTTMNKYSNCRACILDIDNCRTS